VELYTFDATLLQTQSMENGRWPLEMMHILILAVRIPHVLQDNIAVIDSKKETKAIFSMKKTSGLIQI
jgi:hypothetical protein